MPSQARIHVKTGHPQLRSNSHEARSTGSLDPKKSLTRTTRGRVGQPPLFHLLTDKAFNATTTTYVVTAPPAWEQYPCLIPFFLPIPGWTVKKWPLFTPRQALFYRRRPLDEQDDNYRARVFWGSALSVPRRPLSYASTRPRPLTVNKGTTLARRLQGITHPPQHPRCFTVPSSTSP
jgi:hypothetical protein